MNDFADYSKKGQIADELAVIAENGLGRPLWASKTEQDIPYLAALARRTAVDHSLSVEFLVAAIVLPAIKRLPERKKRDAVKKVLWIENLDVSPEEVGARSTERARLTGDGGRNAEAAKLLHYSHSYFERRKRQPLLEEIAEQILTLFPEADSDQSALATAPISVAGTDEDEGVLGYLAFLANLAVTLQYHALVALFVAYFDRILEGGRNHYLAPRALVWEDAEELLFEAFAGFATCLPSFVLLATSDRPSFDILQLFSQQDWDRLRSRIKAVMDEGPPLSGCEMETLRALYEGELGSLKAGRRDHQLACYEATWRPWYQANLLSTDDSRYWPPNPTEIDEVRSLGVAAMARQAQEISTIFIRHIGTSNVLPSEARRIAQKMIVSYYRMDELKPVIEGRSLANHINAFFDTPLN